MSQTIEQQIEAATLALKALRDEKKELTKKEKKPLKGEPMKWTNKAGRTIQGLGVLYYCITLDGVTHLKQVDSPDIVKL